MSRLLENILKNRQQQTSTEFDMTKSGSALLRYLGTDPSYDEDEAPIEPSKSEWQQVDIDNKTCLQKKYELESTKFLVYFINELINLSDELYHHPEILIDHTLVTITLYTRDLNDISERDVMMSKKIDEIIEDINVIKFRR